MKKNFNLVKVTKEGGFAVLTVANGKESITLVQSDVFTEASQKRYYVSEMLENGAIVKHDYSHVAGVLLVKGDSLPSEIDGKDYSPVARGKYELISYLKTQKLGLYIRSNSSFTSAIAETVAEAKKAKAKEIALAKETKEALAEAKKAKAEVTSAKRAELNAKLKELAAIRAEKDSVAASKAEAESLRRLNESIQNRFKFFKSLTAKKIEQSAAQLLSKKRFNISSIVVKGRYNSDRKMNKCSVKKVAIAQFGQNRLSAVESWHDAVVTVSAQNEMVRKEVKNYSENIVQLELPGFINHELERLGNVLYITFKDGVFDIAEKTTSGLVSILSNAPVEDESKFAEYFYANYSTNSIKKGAAYAVRKDVYGNWKKVLEIIVPGFMNEIKAASSIEEVCTGVNPANGKRIYEKVLKISDEKAVKIFGRPSLGLTSSVVLSHVGCIAIYDGTFIPGDESTSDGQGWFTANSEMMTALGVVGIDELYYLSLQARARFATCKMKLDCRGQEFVNEWLEEHEDHITLVGDKNAPVSLVLDANCVKLALKDDKTATDVRLYAVCSEGESGTSTQALAKVAEQAAIAGKLDEFEQYVSAKGCLDLVYLAKREIVAPEINTIPLGTKYLDGVLKALRPTNSLVGYNALKGFLNSAKNKIVKIKFDFDIKYGNLTPDVLATMTDGEQELLGKDADGTIQIFLGGISVKFGKLKRKIKNLSEKVARNAVDDNRDYQAELKEAKKKLDAMEEKYRYFFIVKYPSAGNMEYLKCRVADSYELAEKVSKMPLSEAKMKEALHQIWHSPEGIIMLPNDQRLFRLLAGSDCDFDEAFICFDKILNSFMPVNNSDIILDNKRADRECTSWDVNDALALKAINFQSQLDDNVGSITNEFEVLNLIAIDMRNAIAKEASKKSKELGKKAYDCALVALDEMIGKNNKTDNKKSFKVERPATGISARYIDDVMNELKAVEWSYKNVLAFLEECSYIGRFYQESIIDAAKTGVFFKRIIRCLCVKAAYRSGFNIDYKEFSIKRAPFDKEGKFRSIRNVDENGFVSKTVDREIEYTQFKDVFSRIQDKILYFFNTELRALCLDALEKYAYTESDSGMFVEAMREFRDGMFVKDLGDEAKAEFFKAYERLITTKNIYISIASGKMDAIKSIDAAGMTEEEYDVAVEAINNEFNVYIEGLANNIKAIFALTDSYAVASNALKGALLIGISLLNYKGEYDLTRKNKFAYLCGAEYVAAFLLGGDEYSTTAQINHIESEDMEDGDLVYLNGGIDLSNKIIASSTYTGFATYRSNEYGEYLEKKVNISELSLASESNNSILAVQACNTTSAEDIKAMYDAVDLNDETARYLLVCDAEGEYRIWIYHEGQKGHSVVNAVSGLTIFDKSFAYRKGQSVKDCYFEITGKKVVENRFSRNGEMEVKDIAVFAISR